MKKPSKESLRARKLTLHRESIAQLTLPQLTQAGGGSFSGWPPSCISGQDYN
ncbi:MAG TPA: hypothetical protein VFT22_34735 [Kofleriaceae bacterium]|nr:hypothetical protein [Kofleriaceae bacterium]